MKKIVNFFPILVLIILNIFMVLINDMQEKELYKSFNSYDSSGFIIPENTESISNEDIDELFKAANSHHVLLAKTIYNDREDSIDNYISTDDLIALLSENLEIENINVEDEQGFLATYISNDKSQTQYIHDFLNNDRYSFFPIEEMKKNHIYRYGTYTLYYQNMDDYGMFMNEAESILSTSRESMTNEFWGQLEEPLSIIYTGILICIGFFILFYFILMLFMLYRDTKRLGILSLLGFYNKDIYLLLMKKFIMSIIFICIINVLIFMFLLANVKWKLILDVITLDSFIIGLTILLSYVAMRFVLYYMNTSNMLKKQSLVHKISNLCLVAKFFMVGCMLVFTISLIPIMQSSITATNILKNNQILMKYATFPRLSVENAEQDDNYRYLQFFNEIHENKLDYIYVRFNDYLETDKEIIKNYEELEPTGKGYRTATVDLNYLNQYDITYYSKDGNTINLNEIDQEFYLLPYSKESYTELYTKQVIEVNTNRGIKDPVLIFYYKDREFDSYDSEKGVPKVESPIFRVIHKSNTLTYFESFRGLDIAGTGMSTGLKFNVDGYDNYYQSVLLKYIKNVGLENVLVEDNFVSYEDYYQDEKTKLYKSNVIFFGGLFICLSVYILLVVQTFILYIESRMNEILVKLLIGFTKKDIYANIIYWNIGVTLAPIVGLLSYAIASGSKELVLIFIVSIGFIAIDLLLLLIIMKILRFKNIYVKLKGE